MMKIRRGRFEAKGKKFSIVVSRFNEFITRRLLDSVLETLEQAGAVDSNIEVVWVPGALEIPQFCKKIALKRKPDAVIALGCVLRGDTFHFECVAGEVTRGISQAALETGVPIASGLITADHLEQAIDRAGLKSGNKGAHAALAALEIADLNKQISSRPSLRALVPMRQYRKAVIRKIPSLRGVPKGRRGNLGFKK